MEHRDLLAVESNEQASEETYLRAQEVWEWEKHDLFSFRTGPGVFFPKDNALVWLS